MTKKLFFLLFLFVSASTFAQEIKWMTMNEALEAQKKEPRKIFMDAYTTWCGPCKMLDKNTFSNNKLAQYVNENFYPVKFNAEGTEFIKYKTQEFSNPNFDSNKKGRNSQHEFATAMRISGYPSLVFFDEKGNLLGPLVGYRTAKQLEIYLKIFAEDEYKKLNTKEAFAAYEEDFENEF